MDIYSILGNLIVLSIVGITLSLFRKSDRNSKSLEQVKKYAQKRNEEFDLYVDEKMTQLKDLSVSIEVQEKTGTVILNKISDEVDSLAEKIAHIEELKTKVTGYNSTMDSMLSLSTELEERYTTLRKDSNYIDQLDKKVKDGRKKLQTIEKNIDDITSEFIKNNNSSVNKLKDELFESTNKEILAIGTKINVTSLDVEKLSSQIDDLNSNYNNNAKENLNLFKNNLNTLVEGHRETIERITAQGESLEEASFGEIKDKIEKRSLNLVEILEDKLKLIEESNKEKISKLSMDMGNVEVVANKIKEENKARLDSIKSQLDKQLLMLKEANSQGIASLNQEFALNFNEFKDLSIGEITSCRNESLELISGLKAQIDEASNYKVEIINRYSSTEDYINSELNDLKYRFENSIDDVTKELEDHEEAVKKAAFKQLENNIDLYKDDIDKKLLDLTSVNTRIDQVKDELENRIHQGQIDIENDLKSVKDDIITDREAIELEVSRIKDEFNSISEINTSLINEEKQKFIDSITAVKQSQESLSNELYAGEKEIRDQVLSQRETLLKSVYNDVDSRISTIQDEFNTKISSLNNFNEQIVNAKHSLESLIESNNSAIESKVSGLNDVLLKQIENESVTFNDFINNFNIEKSALRDELEKLKESSYNTVSEKLNIFEDEYFANLKDKEIFIQTETEKWHSQLSTSVNKIKEDSMHSIIDNMESVNSRVKSFQDDLLDELNSFRNINEKKLDDLISNMQSTEKRLTTQNNGFKDKINQEITELNSQISSINNEVVSETNKLRDQLMSLSTEQEKYISETEIFSKTDKLRDELSEAISSLTLKVCEVEEKSDFINITNDKLNALKSLVENVNKQIDSTDIKRVKIETLESRVSKVLELSDSVDEKLTKIKDSEEQISEIQLKLREFKELESSVALEYERLEKKEDILNETNKSIDSGFGHIQILENKLDLLKESLNPFNNQIENIQNKLGRVEERESKIDNAINTLANLDSAVEDLELKITKMDKAREWIAGVETRLNESVRSAEEQVKLMGALAQNKNDNNSSVNSTPAPNMNMRDMVIKLAHQGWKSDAISKTTKLSRGEVELILELSPRK